MEWRLSLGTEMPDKQHAHGKLGNQASRSYGEIEEIIDPLEEQFKEFDKFGMLLYPPNDHYFFHKKSTKFDETTLRVIQKDLEICDLALPTCFYVRAYETRLDLVRTVIVGPACTAPYCVGLFFFDIQLPTTYPHHPPQIYSHFHGQEIDPFQNQNGKVSRCFWNSKEKPLLRLQFTTVQVLSTLRDLIFNGKSAEQKESFSKYAFMKSHYALLDSLAHPPLDFYIFVKGYFRTRAHQILLNYKAHMASDSDSDSEAMKRLFLRLVKAFEGNGTYCGHHYQQHSSLPEEDLVTNFEPSTYFSKQMT